MTAAWVVPTARAIPWTPLAGVAACLATVAVVAAYVDRWPLGLLGIAAAGLAGAVVAGLRDPAEALLAAVPTSAAVRRTRREAMLVPAGLALWLAYLASGQLAEPGPGWTIGPVAALTATGFAVAVWAPTRLAVEAGMVAPLLWCAATQAGATIDRELVGVLFAWQHHPWLVTTAAVAAVLTGRNR
jgi:hypothetical protein